jgi:hypothetical protein
MAWSSLLLAISFSKYSILALIIFLISGSFMVAPLVHLILRHILMHKPGNKICLIVHIFFL